MRLSYLSCTFALVSGSLTLASCLGEGEGGACTVDEDCHGRAEYCDTQNSVCLVDDTVPDRSGDSPGTSFATMNIPFFRGQLCTKMEVISGSQIPFTISPCLHPCLEVTGGYKLQHFWDCTGSSCNAWIIWSIPASGTGCPEDVFGQFDQSQCVYDNALDARLKATIRDDGTPIAGTMKIEVPFLSNEDIDAIVGGDNSTDSILDRVYEYIEQDNRVTDRIRMDQANPQPPEECLGPTNCECINIGF
jgi:hypothetical protein